METITCILCGGGSYARRFTKDSGRGEPFSLVKCRGCGLEFVNPRPGAEDIGKYYEKEYFMQRSDRGYDDYFSPRIEREVKRVTALNMRDLGLDEFEASLTGDKSHLDIGCATGYAVEYMNSRGWKSRGIDISGSCTEFARDRGLSVMTGDYLAVDFGQRFDLITLWATIEHLHRPDEFLKKALSDLHDDGRLYLSTCRAGGLNFMRLYGWRWRFYNFPEHLYFFSHRTVRALLEKAGFRIVSYTTYGSGFGTPGSTVRKIADRLAKRGLGDMMLVGAAKAR